MKKIFYFLMMLMLAFVACTPLEDVYEQIDKEGATPIVGNVVYTLSDKDYTNKRNEGLGLDHNYLESEDQSKELLPSFLADKYSVLGKGSSAKITYKLYFKKDNEKSLIVYKVQNQDYLDAGLRYSSISSNSQMIQLLNHLYPSPSDRVLVSLTYVKRITGLNITVENGFIYSNGTWEKSMGLTADDYAAMGKVRSQFSNKEEALAKIPLFLKNKLQYNSPEKGYIQGVMYKLFVTDKQDIDGDGDKEEKEVYSFVVFYIYNGIDWVEYENTVEKVLQLGHNGAKWVPDNTIKYTLQGADYSLVADNLKSENGYENAASNLANYGNFNRTGESTGDEPTGDSSWNDHMMEKALGIVLEKLNPTAKNNQKYIVTYNMYNGSSGTQQFPMIKNNNKWVKN
ncbi:hypothetical protein [Tenacibaculum maritimum]|uniref:hypothetical protein n=1 Tax=Tenacibaculum maritimum TaxID=107401 RepID=UPI0012E66177|nr:hypothetical protein [Tenacibaculum maritimum]CAA0216399.1 conserved exported hypothetical protein [Tenacibaculum maritimum]